MPTIPTKSEDDGAHSAPHVIVAENYEAPDGSVYVHRDLVKVVDRWSVESHIGPPKGNQRFCDVESWAKFVTTYGPTDYTLTTWSELGLSATLDFHAKDGGDPNRCQWKADHPFVFSPQFVAWTKLANGQAMAQKQLVEALEDLAEDIVSPDQAALLSILRTLRTTAAASGETVINPDGTTSVSWTKESTIKGKAEIPASIAIKIPVLKGHYVAGEDGQMLQRVYEIPIRMRLAVDDGAHVLFRLSMPTAERLLEKVYADRVQAAKDALGSGYSLLRAG